MFSHWFLNSPVLDAQSMACQTNAECILHFSDVLGGTSFTLNQVNQVTGSTVAFTQNCAPVVHVALLNIVPVVFYGQMLYSMDVCMESLPCTFLPVV